MGGVGTAGIQGHVASLTCRRVGEWASRMPRQEELSPMRPVLRVMIIVTWGAEVHAVRELHGAVPGCTRTRSAAETS